MTYPEQMDPLLDWPSGHRWGGSNHAHTVQTIPIHEFLDRNVLFRTVRPKIQTLDPRSPST